MEEKRTKEAPKSFLDHNASWPLMIVYLGFMIGIYFAQQYSYKTFITNEMNGYAYYFIAIIVGVVVTFLFYNLGKIIFASLSGYRVIYVKILGLFIDKSGAKTKVSYNIMDFFTLAMQFAPKDDDVKKNPKLMFFGGSIAEALLLVLALIFLFVFSVGHEKSSISNFGWTFLFAVCYGFLTPLYELLPLRQDYPTDMYNVMMTRSEEDRKAFNIYQINRRRELSGEDFLLPDFKDYDSFYKLHTLYYVYLDDLNESKLEKAFSVLEDMKYYSKYYLEDEAYLPASETVYLKFLIDDEAGANKAFLAIKKDDRKNVTSPMMLSGYRTAVLVVANIHSDKEAVKNLCREFDTLVKGYGEPQSHRIQKEVELFNAAYNKARKMKPDLNLEER